MTQANDPSTSSDGPADETAGSGDYVVQQGDCVASICYEMGHYWKTVWNDGSNAALKDKRKSPYLLLPGDRLTIPAIKLKDVSGASEKQHVFKVKGVPAVVWIKILEVPEPPPPPESSARQSQEGVEFVIQEIAPDPVDPKPAANKPYDTFIDDAPGPSGSTDGEGKIKISILPNAHVLVVRMETGTPRERSLRFLLGGLNPLETASGQAQRLANLGYFVDPSGEDADGLAAAIAQFQKSQTLDPTGQADAATRDKLKDFHGS